MGKLLMTLLGLIGLGVGSWLLYWGVLDAYEANVSSGWPRAQAKITASYVSVRHGRHSYYTPYISYDYSVNGNTYSSTVIAPGRKFAYRSSYSVVAVHPVGSQPMIAYEPGDPFEAVLEPGLHLASFTILLYGMIVLSFSIPIGLLGIFGEPDPDGKPGSLKFPEDSNARRLTPVFIIFTLLEVALLFWINWH